MKNLCYSLRFICISIFIAISSGSATAATNYSLTLLKDSPNAARSGSNVIDIDPTGLVVGQSFSSDFDNHAAIWFDTENPTDLTPNFAFSDSSARGINSRQEVVVRLNNGTAFLWIDGTRTSIVSLTGASVFTSGINDATQIVGTLGGTSPSAKGNERAFIWENGVMTDLGTLPGGGGSAANALNNFSQVVGSAFNTKGDEHAVIWNSGVLTDLGTLSGDVGSEAHSINDAGVVVGESFTTEKVKIGSNTYTIRDVVRAFTWSNGVMTELDRAGSRAIDINNVGQIVGSKKIANEWHAVVWNNGVITDLNPFLNSLNCLGNALNDNGQIIGNCTDADRYPLSFRLTPSDSLPSPPTNNEADVEVNISASSSKVKHGEELEYTVVITNNGPDTAADVVLTDKLPSNVNFVSVSGTGCSGTTNITCLLGELSSGASEIVLITVIPFEGNRITNSVSVTSSTTDPVSNNNTDKVRTRVRR